MKKGVYTSYTLTTLLRGLATVIDILDRYSGERDQRDDGAGRAAAGRRPQC